jgi:HK97 family phage major capsid protein
MTDKELNDLKQKRAKAVADARAIHEIAIKEKRELTTEQSTQYDAFMNEASNCTKSIQREENLRKLSAEGDKINTRDVITDTLDTDPDADPATRSQAKSLKELRSSKEYRDAFNKFLLRGKQALSQAEFRDLSTGSDVDGGYLVAPVQMVSELLKNLDDAVYIRSKARKFTLVQAKSLGVIKRTAKMSTWARGTEISTPTKDTSMAFGKRELHPQYMTGLALVSRDLLRNSSLPPEQLIREEMAMNAAEVQEQEFMTGSGAAGAALGVFTASADGISTGRDVSTGNTTTAITFDGLIEAKFSLKPQYRRTAEWMFHRTAVKQIAKIKDGEGRYIWELSKQAGEPDRILGLPYVESEWVPSTFTTGLYVGILANWNYYWIADALDVEIQRLVELYALSNQDGFVGRLKMDAAPQLEEAFARVKLA